jgi:hypothetical protein
VHLFLLIMLLSLNMLVTFTQKIVQMQFINLQTFTQDDKLITIPNSTTIWGIAATSDNIIVGDEGMIKLHLNYLLCKRHYGSVCFGYYGYIPWWIMHVNCLHVFSTGVVTKG